MRNDTTNGREPHPDFDNRAGVLDEELTYLEARMEKNRAELEHNNAELEAKLVELQKRVDSV